MSQLLVSTKVNGEVVMLKSDKIQFLMSELVGSFASLFGWQVFYCPKHNQLLVNVPTSAPTGAEQLAVNEVTSAEPWTRFQGLDANTWCLFNEEPYFGGPDGVVYRGWTGGLDSVDLDGAGGTDIKASCQQAYTQFSSAPTQKQVGMYRLNFTYRTPFGYSSNVVYDYQVPEIGAPPPPTGGAGGALWDAALWDVDYWGGGRQVSRLWKQANGMGVVASPAIAVQAQDEVLWISTDYSYRSGGLL
jgi:hypothetical protein